MRTCTHCFGDRFVSSPLGAFKYVLFSIAFVTIDNSSGVNSFSMILNRTSLSSSIATFSLISLSGICMLDKESCIFLSNTDNSDFNSLNSSSFFQVLFTTSCNCEISRSKVIISSLYCKINAGIRSKALTKFIAAAVVSAIAITPLL